MLHNADTDKAYIGIDILIHILSVIYVCLYMHVYCNCFFCKLIIYYYILYHYNILLEPMQADNYLGWGTHLNSFMISI